MKTLISILSAGLLLTACSKAPQQDYTAKLGGVKIWHGASSGTDFVTGPYSAAITDTFAITIVDKHTIQMQGRTLYFKAKDNKLQTIVFAEKQINPSIAGSHLIYYYANGSMHYESATGSSALQQNIALDTP